MKAYARFDETLNLGYFLQWAFNFIREICKFSATLAPPIWTG